MRKFIKLILPVLLFFLSALSTPISAQNQKPNIIFILCDDIGYSALTVNGGHSFSTPNLDSMARHGMSFTHCEASASCSPSRFMLLTGKYNFRNYSNWGYFDYDEKTFGNMMQDAGYQTAFFGKVQSMITDSSLTNWGFNKYDVFELTQDTVKEHRYKNPSLVSDTGRLTDSTALNKFSDDILTKDVFNFIDDNHNNPFFIYYPMALCHSPFSPTPDDTAFAAWDPDNGISDTSFFPSMMKYMDKKVGAILQKLRSTDLAQKTIVIFAGDNGFSKLISYTSDDGEGGGEKGTTLEEGTHVPLIAYWPWHIKKPATGKGCRLHRSTP